MDPAIIALLIPILAVGGGTAMAILSVLNKHQIRLEELRARDRVGISDELRAELTAMKAQVSELRNTTTKFDMSFDSALTRLEERMDRVETRQATAGRGGPLPEVDTTAAAAATLSPRA